MLIKDVIDKIEKFAPIELAEEWDNVGLLLGNKNNTLNGVVIAVDLTDDLIEYAIKQNCNLIITHHPAIFTGLNNLDEDILQNKIYCKCIKNEISVYSAHTNMDMAVNGINDATFSKLNIPSKRFLQDGLGVIGDVDCNFEEFLNKILQLTGEKFAKLYKTKEHLKKVAFIGGSGGGIEEVVAKSLENNVDCVVSSEFKHHIILQLLQQGVSIIQIGHYESEKIFVEIVFDLLKTRLDNIYKYYTNLIK